MVASPSVVVACHLAEAGTCRSALEAKALARYAASAGMDSGDVSGAASSDAVVVALSLLDPAPCRRLHLRRRHRRLRLCP